MANYWLVKDDKSMVLQGNDELKARHCISADFMWLEVPEGIAPGNCKVSGEWPDLSLVDGSADKSSPQWAAFRTKRDAMIQANRWILERHQDQVARGVATTLSEGQYTGRLTYIQYLRDLPANTAEPDLSAIMTFAQWD